MLRQNEMLRETLQRVENEEHDGSLVVSFIGIAETVNPSDSGVTGYTYYVDGSPAMRLGLLRYLEDVFLRDMEEDRE